MTMPNPFEEKLKQFAEDEVMFNAVRGHLLSKCDLNTLYDDEVSRLAEDAKAFIKARRLIEDAFREIGRYAFGKSGEKQVSNPAV